MSHVQADLHVKKFQQRILHIMFIFFIVARGRGTGRACLAIISLTRIEEEE